MSSRAAECIAAILLITLLSGCSGLDIPDHPLSPELVTPPTAPQEWVVTGQSCWTAHVVILVEFSRTRQFLPAGYQPLDAAQLIGVPYPTERAAALATATSCHWLDTESIVTASTGILVEPPEPALTPAVNIYEVERYVLDGAFHQNLTALGWPARTASDITVEPRIVGDIVARPKANVEGAGRSLFWFDGNSLAQDEKPANLTRLWRVTENGSGYVETPLQSQVFAGSGTCDVSGTKLVLLVDPVDPCPADAIITTMPPQELQMRHVWRGR